MDSCAGLAVFDLPQATRGGGFLGIPSGISGFPPPRLAGKPNNPAVNCTKRPSGNPLSYLVCFCFWSHQLHHARPPVCLRVRLPRLLHRLGPRLWVRLVWLCRLRPRLIRRPAAPAARCARCKRDARTRAARWHATTARCAHFSDLSLRARSLGARTATAVCTHAPRAGPSPRGPVGFPRQRLARVTPGSPPGPGPPPVPRGFIVHIS